MFKEKIVPIGVKYKQPVDEGAFLKIAPRYSCLHGPFLIDEKLAEVECEKCHEKLNPMHVLIRLAREETVWQHLHERFEEEKAALDARRKTKCQHCRQMTRISRN